jgi:hypothetical protein
VKNISASIVVILLGVAAFCLTVFFVAANNPSAFGDLALSDVAPAVLGAILWPVVAAVVACVAFRYLDKEREFQSLAIFVAGFIAVAGLVLPTLQSSAGMMDVSEIDVSWINLAISLSIAAALAALWYRGLGTIAVIGLSVMLLSALVTTLYPLLAARASSEERKRSIFDVSRTNNVFVLSFDALQADLMAQVIRDHNGEWSHLQDFTFYKNVVGVAPATTASIAAEVSGNYDYKGIAETSRELAAYAADRSILNLFDKIGEVRSYGFYSDFVPASLVDLRELTSRGERARKGVYLTNTSIARIFYRGKFSLFSNYDIEDGSLAARLDNHKGANWDIRLIISRSHFEKYVDNLQVTTDAPMAHFLHFAFTHHPVDFDADCRYRSDDAEWHSKHQNTEGLLAESICAARSFESFLSKLSQLGVYDDALIILKSDHGQPNSLNTGFPAQRIRSNAAWGVGRYMPTLLIKPPMVRRSDMAIDTRRFILSDLAMTLCIYAGEEDCAKYSGFDLLDPATDPEGEFYMSIVQGPKSDFKHDTHETIKVRRGDLGTILAPYIKSPAQR